jgi:hypothetical protein
MPSMPSMMLHGGASMASGEGVDKGYGAIAYEVLVQVGAVTSSLITHHRTSSHIIAHHHSSSLIITHPPITIHLILVFQPLPPTPPHPTPRSASSSAPTPPSGSPKTVGGSSTPQTSKLPPPSTVPSPPSWGKFFPN